MWRCAISLLHDHGILVSLGRGETAGKILRIGHMGASAEPAFARTINFRTERYSIPNPSAD